MVTALPVRPYQLLCLPCAQGHPLDGPEGAAVARLQQAIREFPDRPLTLVCAAGDVYAYQDPADPRAHSEFQRKRDLDILQRLDLAPGSTLPARTLLYRVLKAIPTVCGLCGYEGESSLAWSGCPRAFAGHYEQGHALGIGAVIPPREPEEMQREKAASVAGMAGGPLAIRPHVILCAVCNYGANDGHPAPLAADNIVEFIDIIRRHPETPVRLARGADWMICAPCPQRVADLNACVNVAGSGGLSNEKRDLDVLQKLDLTYETVLPARELLLRIFAVMPTTAEVCARDNPPLSVWWDGCGEANCSAGNAGYDKGRRLLLEEWSDAF
jgi:hypothetical protein